MSLSRGFGRFHNLYFPERAIHLSKRTASENSMPVCRCHSFDLLETPILSHAQVSALVTLSALEVIHLGVERTDRERQAIHDKLMKLQEDFLRQISDRLQGYERVLRAKWRESERRWQKFE